VSGIINQSDAWRHRDNDAGITASVSTIILVISNMVAICFYTPASYEELKKVADDKKNLCDTYADWLVEFSKAVSGLREQGLEAVPVNINIGELKKWCKQNNLKNTSSSRSKYVLKISNSQFPNSD
jgi:hypothetical protein